MASSFLGQMKKGAQSLLKTNNQLQKHNRISGHTSQQQQSISPLGNPQVGISNELNTHDEDQTSDTPRKKYDDLPLEEKSNMLEQDLDYKSQELTVLQSQYNELESRNTVIDEMRQNLAIKLAESQTHWENLNSDFLEKEECLRRCDSELRGLKADILPLWLKLGKEDQTYIDRHGRQATWILKYSLAQFDRNEQEKVKDRQNLTDLHQGEIGDLKAKHQKELELLQAEFVRLEQGLLTNVDSFRPITDADFKAKFAMLKKSVSDLARRPPNLNPDQVGQLSGHKDLVCQLPRKHWRFLLESAFWIIIVDAFFLTPFSIFGDHGMKYATTWCALFDKDSRESSSSYNWPKPDTASEHWRSITFKAILQHVEENSTNISTDENIRRAFEANLKDLSERISCTLRKVSQDEPDSVGLIVDQARKLALEIGAQRCRLQLVRPGVGETVPRNSTTYDDVNNNNEAFIPQGIVQLAVAPGLRRTGDARGYSFSKAIDICPAAVYLRTS